MEVAATIMFEALAGPLVNAATSALGRNIEMSTKTIMNIAQIHLVVATLLVTVTFAAGFTLPGGFESGDDNNSVNKGMAILAKKKSVAFTAFVVTDAIAFVCSAGAVFSYFVVATVANLELPAVQQRIIVKDIFWVATYLQFLSMSAVVIAFITGRVMDCVHSTLPRPHHVGIYWMKCLFILRDDDYELKYRSELKGAVLRAKAYPQSLFKGYDIRLAPRIHPPIGTLPAIVKSAGGNTIKR